MSRSGTSTTDIDGARAKHKRTRRLRWRLVLLGGIGVLVVYYALIVGGMRLNDSGDVDLDDASLTHSSDRVTLQVEAASLDPASGSFDLRLRPVPQGTFAAGRTGQLRQPLQVRLIAAGEPAAAFDFPAKQIIDPVAASVGTTTGSQRFPFDRPQMAFRLEATSKGERVPLDVRISDQTDGWDLSGAVVSSDQVLHVDLAGRREMLSISFALFYLGGIVVVALITVAVIGGAIVRGRVDFDQVIWLGAMLVAVPAVRNEMPGVPPIGTAIDLWIFLPSVVIVGLALLAAIVVLVVNEAAANASGVEPDVDGD
jgi:hypothetical protein